MEKLPRSLSGLLGKQVTQKANSPKRAEDSFSHATEAHTDKGLL